MAARTPTTHAAPSDSSVTFSLSELVEMERQRLREERERESDAERKRAARARDEAERARAQADEARARDEAARRERTLVEAEAKARVEGQKQAVLDVARIEAEARIKIEADEAARRHEIALLRARLDHRSARGRTAIAIALALSVVVGVVFVLAARASAVRFEGEVASLRLEVGRLRDQRDEALDRGDAAERDAADARRKQRDVEAARVVVLDQRRGDLAGWAADRRRPELLAPVVAASERARDEPSAASIAAYERALGTVRDALGASERRTIGAAPSVSDDTVPPTGKCTNPNDPLCGFGGRGL